MVEKVLSRKARISHHKSLVEAVLSWRSVTYFLLDASSGLCPGTTTRTGTNLLRSGADTIVKDLLNEIYGWVEMPNRLELLRDKAVADIISRLWNLGRYTCEPAHFLSS